MAFTLIFSAETPIFAGGGGDNCIPTKNIIPPRKSTYLNSLSTKRKFAQKAFLTGLLCSTGTNIEISIYKNNTSHYRFSIKKINNGEINFPKKSKKYSDELGALLNALQNKNFKFEFSNSGRYNITYTLLGAKINGYFLKQSTIYKIGKKILKIIDEWASNDIYRSFDTISINDNIDLKNEILNAFGDLLECEPDKNEETIEFFELPSDAKKLDPIVNPIHVNYLKQNPEGSSHLVVCYQKMLLSGLLSAFGAKTIMKLNGKFDDEFPECIKLFNMLKPNLRPRTVYYRFLNSIIEYINTHFEPQKLRVETTKMAYSSPVKTVIINNCIFLNENDVFNLGQKFYNLINEIICKYPIEESGHCGLIDLSEITIFTQNVKIIFKEYTGTDLPDLK